MVDVDPAELAKLSDVVEMPICADAGSFLREMLAQKASIAAVDRSDWQTRCKGWKSRYPIIQEEHRAKGRSERLSPCGGNCASCRTAGSACIRQFGRWY